MSIIGDLSQRQLAIGGAVLAGVVYLRRQGDEPERNAAENTPELQQQREQALARLRNQGQTQERINPDTGRLTRSEAMDIIESNTEEVRNNAESTQEEFQDRLDELNQGEPDNASRADRRSPAQTIREYQDELPDDVEWENRVEYDPVTGEPYNPVQLAWLATNVLPDKEGYGELPDDSDDESGDGSESGDSGSS